jgi:hypothetical protein
MEQFPRMLHKPDGSKLIVDTQEDQDAKEKDGWQLHAGPAPDPVKPAKTSGSQGPSEDDGPPAKKGRG